METEFMVDVGTHIPLDPVSIEATGSPERSKTKVEHVVSRLRSAILTGKYNPGSSLQTYDELEPMLQVSRATLRSAIRQLKEEGFIESCERSHMYVSRTPPHLSRYGLALRDLTTQSRFVQALVQVAEKMRESSNINLVLYHGIFPGSKHPDYERLKNDIRTHRLAGLIVRSQAKFFAGTGALEDDTLPKIALRNDDQPGFNRVMFDYQSLANQAVDWFVAQGRRKIAIIANGIAPSIECFERACAARHIDLRPEWKIGLGLDFPEAANNTSQLMMALPPECRPDALLVSDDNFVEHACAGLAASRVRVPAEVSIAVHCNWPWPVASVLPAARFGFDADEVLKQAIDMIGRVRRGQNVSDVLIPARSELSVKAGANRQTQPPHREVATQA